MTTLLLRSRDKHNRGFSLIEIAVVLVIISILLAIVAVPLSTQVDQRRRAETMKQLDLAKDAITGFAISNGRLPCPALKVAGCMNGSECFCPASGACTPTMIKPSPFLGACAAFGNTTPALNVGLLPAASLGIAPTDENGYGLDGFNTSANLIYYAVAEKKVGSVDNALTADNGIKTATMTTFAGATPLVTVCPTSALTCTSANSLTSTAPFVVFSLGANAGIPYASLSAKEKANLDNDLNRLFVSGNKTDDFDDVLTWESINVLFERMVRGGKLP
jgi:prepilin-type N-terminal cleavage/methylation domain-containing protein